MKPFPPPFTIRTIAGNNRNNIIIREKNIKITQKGNRLDLELSVRFKHTNTHNKISFYDARDRVNDQRAFLDIFIQFELRVQQQMKWKIIIKS